MFFDKRVSSLKINSYCTKFNCTSYPGIPRRIRFNSTFNNRALKAPNSDILKSLKRVSLFVTSRVCFYSPFYFKYVRTNFCLPKFQWNSLCWSIYLSIHPHSTVSSVNTRRDNTMSFCPVTMFR